LSRIEAKKFGTRIFTDYHGLERNWAADGQDWLDFAKLILPKTLGYRQDSSRAFSRREDFPGNSAVSGKMEWVEIDAG
jgi:hypothetical protein